MVVHQQLVGYTVTVIVTMSHAGAADNPHYSPTSHNLVVYLVCTAEVNHNTKREATTEEGLQHAVYNMVYIE